MTINANDIDKMTFLRQEIFVLLTRLMEDTNYYINF